MAIKILSSTLFCQAIFFHVDRIYEHYEFEFSQLFSVAQEAKPSGQAGQYFVGRNKRVQQVPKEVC